MANNKRSKSSESYSALYKSSNREATNREKNLKRTLKAQPNNKQVEQALKDIKKPHRTAPKNPHWSASMIATAMIVKDFCGKVHADYFHQDPKKQAEARRSAGPIAQRFDEPRKGYSTFAGYFNPNNDKIDPKFGPFSIAMRIVAKGGTPWSI